MDNLKMKRFKHYIRQQLTVGNVLIFLFFLFFAFTMLYSLCWAFFSSLKDPTQYFRTKGDFFPDAWMFSNYGDAFVLMSVRQKNIFDMIFNSLWLTIGNSFISMAVCCTTAYIVSKYDFVGKRVITTVILVALMLPLYGSLPSTLKLYTTLGMYNSPLILLAAASGMGSMFLILRSYFNGVSWEYAEAAKIDGANDFIIYVRIMIPIAAPALGSILMVMFINGWNDYMTSIYFLPDYPTIASGLYLYEEISEFSMNYPVFFAGVVMASIPTMVLFILFQKQIMSSITTGGLKG